MENVKITEILDLGIDFFAFAKTKADAKIPTKRTEDAGYDIYACFDEDYIIIPPLTSKFIDTGIATALSSNFYLEAKERGSNASKNMKVSAGVIDSGFRDSIKICIENLNDNALIISKHSEEDTKRIATERKDIYKFDNPIFYPYSKGIAQLILHKVHNELEPKEISYDTLKNIPSERGMGMCGSSGK